MEDHCDAIDFLYRKGENGEIYNIGAGNELNNLEITDIILKELGKPQSLMTFVKDRLGHDRRYSLDCTKLRQMGWAPGHSFDQAMELTIRWYVDNRWWWEKLKSGEYLEFYKSNYQMAL